MAEFDPFVAAGLSVTNPAAAPAAPQQAPVAATPIAASPAAPIQVAPDPVISQAPIDKPTETPAPAPVALTPTFEIDGEKFATFDDVVKSYKGLKTKSEVDPFANEYVKGLNKAIQDGIDPATYFKFNELNPKKISDREAHILYQEMKNKLTPEEAALYVDSTYRFGEGEDAEDGDVKLARIRAKAESGNVREFLESHRAESLIPPAEKQLERQKAAWIDVLPKTIQEHSTIEIKGNTGAMNFAVPPEILKSTQDIMQKAIDGGFIRTMPTEEGRNQVKEFINQTITVKSLPAIYDYMNEQFKLKVATEQNNPRTQTAGTPPPSKSDKQLEAEFIAADYGIKLG